MLESAACITPATLRLVTVPEVKAQSRIDSGHEDTLLDGYIAAAERAVEDMCRRAFLPQTWRAYYRCVMCGKPEMLPRSPVSSVVVSYRDSATTWATASVTTITDGAPGLWYPPANVTPYAMTDGSPEWRAVVECGGAGETVPTPLRQAVIILAAHLFEQRTPIVVGASVAEVPHHIMALIEPWKAPNV